MDTVNWRTPNPAFDATDAMNCGRARSLLLATDHEQVRSVEAATGAPPVYAAAARGH